MIWKDHNNKQNYVVSFILIAISLLIMAEFKISSLNLNGARDIKKRASFFELIKLKNIDISFVQETHSCINNEVDWHKEWDGTIIMSHKSSTSAGVAILFSRSFSPLSYEVEEIIVGRLIKVTARYEGKKIIFINVYAPVIARERMIFLEKLIDTLEGCNSEEFLFLAGDFNCTTNNLDRNHVEPHMASRNKLISIVEAFDLADVWREKHRDFRQYSWTHYRENYISMARIDRIYCYKHHLQIFKSCAISPVSFSDHGLVCGVVFINSIKIKSAYWHLNVSLLNDNFLKKSFMHFWNNWKINIKNFESIQQWWDVGKINIQQFCKQYTLNTSRNTAKLIEEVEYDIIKLQVLSDSTRDQTLLQSIKKKKDFLGELLGIKGQGSLIRSRFQNFNEMDTSTRFFFSLEKKKTDKVE